MSDRRPSSVICPRISAIRFLYPHSEQFLFIFIHRLTAKSLLYESCRRSFCDLTPYMPSADNKMRKMQKNSPARGSFSALLVLILDVNRGCRLVVLSHPGLRRFRLVRHLSRPAVHPGLLRIHPDRHLAGHPDRHLAGRPGRRLVVHRQIRPDRLGYLVRLDFLDLESCGFSFLYFSASPLPCCTVILI